MAPDHNKEIEPKPARVPTGGPAPERSGFAYGSLVFGTLSLLGALLLNMTIFGAIMGGMGLGYALVARSSKRRILVLAGAILSIAGLLVSLRLAGVF
jgi:hypothetical protein